MRAKLLIALSLFAVILEAKDGQGATVYGSLTAIPVPGHAAFFDNAAIFSGNFAYDTSYFGVTPVPGDQLPVNFRMVWTLNGAPFSSYTDTAQLREPFSYNPQTG